MSICDQLGRFIRGLRNDKEVLKYLADHEQAALEEFLTKLRAQHGSEVVLVRLFGSKVRGDFDEESDIDVLLVVEDRTSQLWEDVVEIETEDDIATAQELIASGRLRGAVNRAYYAIYHMEKYLASVGAL